MEEPEEAVPERSSKAFIACVRCKARKRRCDGTRPKCSKCIAAGEDCEYATVRKTRGPGKKGKQPSLETETSSSHEEDSSQGTLSLTTLRIAENDPRAKEQQFPFLATTGYEKVPLVEVPGYSSPYVEAEQPRTIFPPFLASASFLDDMQQVKNNIGQVRPEKGYTALLPIHMTKRLLGNSFDDITKGHPIMSRSEALLLLEAQYAVNPDGPANEPARWAVINALLAVALRFKIASGSEGALLPIARAYYDNARMVLGDLILGELSLMSVQALLAMALFARNERETRSFIMLVTNASGLLDLFKVARSGIFDAASSEADQYEHLRRVTETFEYATQAVLQ